MNVILWFLAGGAAGWFACSVFRLNAGRGLVVSAIIGMAGAFFGGNVLTPAFGVLEDHSVFNPFALLIAVATAIACLKIADMLYERFQF